MTAPAESSLLNRTMALMWPLKSGMKSRAAVKIALNLGAMRDPRNGVLDSGIELRPELAQRPAEIIDGLMQLKRGIHRRHFQQAAGIVHLEFVLSDDRARIAVQ